MHNVEPALPLTSVHTLTFLNIFRATKKFTMKDSDLGGEISGQHSESVLITRNKVGKPRFPASVLACKHLQTQSRTDFFLAWTSSSSSSLPGNDTNWRFG